MNVRLNSKVTILGGRFRCGVIALSVMVALWSRPLACTAQTTGDGEFAAQRADAQEFFRKRVAPFIKDYCIDCHQNRRPTEAGVNFSPALKDPGDAAFTELWTKAFAMVKTHAMPPEDTGDLPTDAQRQTFLDGIARIKFLSAKDPGPFVIRRLTKEEYGNTLRDLFGVEPSIADSLPDEVSGEGYLNSLSPLQLEQYLTIANRVLDRILAVENAPPTEIQIRLFGEPPLLEADIPAAARSVAESLAKKAYRRPPSEAELKVLLEVFDLGMQNDLAYQEALGLMVKAILVSPQFLFITPAGDVEPGVLAVTSFPNRTSPVKRGMWVLEQVLGDHIPSPPPDIPALDSQDQKTVANLTLRERTELHRSNPVCANCHRTLDPIGFGLENFDAIGRWRDLDDNGEAIDASGELPGGKRFSGPKELKTIVGGRVDELARNLVEKLLAYGLCRKLEGYDEIVVDGLMRDIAKDGYRMRTLVIAVVTSYPFTNRRIEENRTSNE